MNMKNRKPGVGAESRDQADIPRLSAYDLLERKFRLTSFLNERSIRGCPSLIIRDREVFGARLTFLPSPLVAN